METASKAIEATPPLPPTYDELPKEIREELPPQRDVWTDAPGELVWKYEADPEKEALGMTGFSWQVRKLVPGVHFQTTANVDAKVEFQASTPYRAVFYTAATAEEALACLLKGMCHLSREGAINPNIPMRPGSPPIQHAIHILTERLLQCVEQRQHHLFMSGYADNPAHVGAVPLDSTNLDTVGDDSQAKKARDAEAERMDEQVVRAISRDNEVISALATAVSALARVKDL